MLEFATTKSCRSLYCWSASQFRASGSVEKCFSLRTPFLPQNRAEYLPSFLWQIPFPHSLPFRFLPIMNSFLISKKKSPTHLFHYRAGLSFFQHAEINFYLLRIIGKTSNDEIISYICLKFLTLYQFARTNVKNEWAVRLLQHGINFVDTDVAIFCCLPNGQKHLLVNW